MTNRPSLDVIRAAVETEGGKVQAERFLRAQGFDISESAIRRALSRSEAPAFSVDQLPEIDVDELIKRRISQFEAKKKVQLHNRTIPVTINVDGPIGLGFVGDPHVDDDGTDIDLLFRHAEIFDGRNEALFAVCLGDIWNNWQGRLAHLWGEQSTSAEEARALARRYLNMINWLAIVWGNHDLWGKSQDLLSAMISNPIGAQKSSRANLALRFPNNRVLKISAAHRFPGSSQWSTVFGPSKRAQLDGTNHIYVAGDLHISGYTHGWHEGNQILWHAVQVASYKQFDRYAEDLNLVDKSIYQCPVAIIDPNAKEEVNFIRWEFDPFEGAERLKWMRDRWAS